jgi:hypothetical protein
LDIDIFGVVMLGIEPKCLFGEADRDKKGAACEAQVLAVSEGMFVEGSSTGI